MKAVNVTVVKAIKIDAGPYRTKSYRSAHTAAQDYASKSNEVWFAKMSPGRHVIILIVMSNDLIKFFVESSQSLRQC